jgi:hypothetical protein
MRTTPLSLHPRGETINKKKGKKKKKEQKARTDI